MTTASVAIIGAGSWGVALGCVAGRGNHQVKLWTRRPAIADAINHARTHPQHLTNVRLPETMRATCDVNEAVHDADLIVLAVPSHTARETWRTIHRHIKNEALIVSAMKGIEIETGATISTIVASESSTESIVKRFTCLSGPSFAMEVASDQPTAVVAASVSHAAAKSVQQVFSQHNFRVYTNDDVTGVELGGAAKNTIALAAGMVHGLELGANALAALITRGLAEMTRFAVAMGARRETLTGLAGLGDLVLTCHGSLSRNRFVGQELARGRTLEQVLSTMTEVAEGVKTTRAIKRIADARHIEMPITTAIDEVLYREKDVALAVSELMRRPLRDEAD